VIGDMAGTGLAGHVITVTTVDVRNHADTDDVREAIGTEFIGEL
jgi:hypothetical protein